MKRFLALAIVLAALAPAVEAQTTSFTGKWEGTFKMQRPDGTEGDPRPVVFDLTQKGKVLTGTVGPNAERQWPIEKGAVDGSKVTFQVQQPDGPLRTFTLNLVKERLEGEMLAEMNGQSFTAKVDAGRAKDK
jgi:hypothetical protein